MAAGSSSSRQEASRRRCLCSGTATNNGRRAEAVDNSPHVDAPSTAMPCPTTSSDDDAIFVVECRAGNAICALIKPT